MYSVSVARAGCKRKLQPRKRRFLCGNAWPIRKRPPHTRWPRNPTGVSAIRLRGWHWLRARSDRFRPEIRHHIGHAAHVERQCLGVEAHEIRLGTLRQRWFIGRIDAGDHGGCMAGRKLATHHFRQIHATSRRIGLLRRDIQNAHTRHLSFEFESSYRDAKGSCASRPRIAQASSRKAESPKVRKDLSARKRHARYD